MKKILLSAALAATSLLSFAQTPAVPNGGFENWEDASCEGTEIPSGYISAADLFNEENGFCPSSTGITKATNKYSGTYALQLKPQVFLGASLGNGVFLQSDFTGRPTKLVGYTMFTKGGTDTLGIFVGIGDENDDEVAYGEVTLSASQGDYTKFEITLDYTDNTSEPTYVVIGFTIGNTTNGYATASTTALIDALSFEYTATSTVNYAAKSPINVFAANNVINFSENVSDVHVVDMLGANKIQEAASTKTVSANSLNSGLYIVTYNYNGNYFSKKVVIE
jgi:hypothetical protein